MGIAAQAEQTGIHYFLSGPNASDRIATWPNGRISLFTGYRHRQTKLLFWQCQPYSIGYRLKGTKIPNFFTIDDPKLIIPVTPKKTS